MAPQSRSERAARPPLEGMREAPFTLSRATDDDEPNDGLTLDGWGAVFNQETIIDSFEGKFREKNALGSMKRSFRETPPKIQYDHGRHPLLGSWAIAELRHVAEEVDPELAPEGGAHIIGRIFDRWYTEPVRDGIESGAINGMSYRFSVVQEQWETADGKIIRDEQKLMDELRRTWFEDVPDDELLLRTVKQMKVPEMGPVMWPAYEQTSVSLRSKVIDLGRLHEPGQRKLLARAVFLADAAEKQDDSQQATDDSVGERQSTENDAQRATDPVGERPSPDAQRSTPVGERPSKPRGRRAIDLMVRKSRDVLIDIERNKKTA